MNTLEKANALITGDRQQTYGPPVKNMAMIAKRWTMWLRSQGKLAERQEIEPHDVPMMMLEAKISREMHRGKEDNPVDGCGYLGIYGDLRYGKGEK